MRFTYTVAYDWESTPWGDPRWVPVIVTAHAVGPLQYSADVGTVVELCEEGTYDSVDKIPDEYLRTLAREQAENVERVYLDALITKRDEINAMIQQMGGC